MFNILKNLSINFAIVLVGYYGFIQHDELANNFALFIYWLIVITIGLSILVGTNFVKLRTKALGDGWPMPLSVSICFVLANLFIMVASAHFFLAGLYTVCQTVMFTGFSTADKAWKHRDNFN